MQKNYPATIQEALSPISSLSAFDGKVLDEMMGDTRNPIREGLSPSLDPLIVHIYQPYHIGEFYIAGSDIGHGIGKDNSVTTIMNVRTGAVVADIMTNSLDPREFALHSVQMLREYKEPLWFIENNDWGRIVINVAQELGYKNLGYQDDKKTKVGWNTNEKTRIDLFGGLIPAVNNHQVPIYNS